MLARPGLVGEKILLAPTCGHFKHFFWGPEKFKKCIPCSAYSPWWTNSRYSTGFGSGCYSTHSGPWLSSHSVSAVWELGNPGILEYDNLEIWNSTNPENANSQNQIRSAQNVRKFGISRNKQCWHHLVPFQLFFHGPDECKN